MIDAISDLYHTAVAGRAAAAHGKELALTARYRAREIAIGAAGVHRENVQARTLIGAPLFHTVGDRLDMIKQMSTEFAQLENAMAMALGWTADAPTVNTNDPRYAWWLGTAVPLLNEWQKFQAKETDSWWVRFATDWSEIEQWHDRLVSLHEAATKAGFPISSAKPAPLNMTVWQEAGKKFSDWGGDAADAFKAIWSLVKTLFYAALTIAGAFGIVHVYRELKAA